MTATQHGTAVPPAPPTGYRQELHRGVGSFSSFAAGFSFVSILTTVFQLFGLGFGLGGAAFFWACAHGLRRPVARRPLLRGTVGALAHLGRDLSVVEPPGRNDLGLVHRVDHGHRPDPHRCHRGNRGAGSTAQHLVRFPEIAADPVGVNARLGRFTNFANLLDMAALAVPAGFVDGRPFGVMFTGPAFSDRSLAVLAGRLANPMLQVFVVGAHLTGQPLNAQMISAGGTLVGPARTAQHYRLHVLDTVPAKPGLVRVADDGAGHAIEGEVWRVPAAGFGGFVAAIPAPLTIGTIELEDGRHPSGFLVEPYAVRDAPDISHHGGWRAHLAAHAGRSN